MEGRERRKRVLTDEDLEEMTEMLRQHIPVCSIGLTVEDAIVVKKGVITLNRAANIIGTVIIVALATGVMALFTKGFWMSLVEGAKH